MDTAFSGDYASARGRFLTQVQRSSGRLRSVVLEEHSGPHGEQLATDIAWFGPDEPRGVVIVTSATHGVEGYAGSAVQTQIARTLAGMSTDASCAVVLVHALNPFGFAHTRRVNEHNVDLNRNFVDFARLPAADAQYAQLHPLLVPMHWDGPERRQSDQELARIIDERGLRAFQEAACAGQYSLAEGLFYGGRQPSWSNAVWRGILRGLPRGISCVAHIDIHTGLGPFGYGEILCTLSADRMIGLARAWYGELGLRMHGSEDSAATTVCGTMNHALLDLPPHWQVCTVSVEFGTVELTRMLDALRADNWLHVHGDIDSALGRRIKSELRDCFDPDDSSWRCAVIERGLRVFETTQRRVRECVTAS